MALDKATMMDRSISRVEETIHRRASFTEIMRKTLEFCRARRAFADVEREMAAFPEFAYSDQSQASIIGMLVDAGALDERPLDSEGRVVETARANGRLAQWDDERVHGFDLQTTEAGIAVIEKMKPEDLLDELFAQEPEREGFYQRLLEECRSPKTFEQLEQSISAVRSLESRNSYSSLRVYPSALVAKLEKAGGIVWSDAWAITPAGERKLRELLSARSEIGSREALPKQAQKPRRRTIEQPAREMVRG